MADRRHRGDTVRVATFSSPADSNVVILGYVNGVLYFTIDNGVLRKELWKLQ
jgi:hypothetical protein